MASDGFGAGVTDHDPATCLAPMTALLKKGVAGVGVVAVQEHSQTSGESRCHLNETVFLTQEVENTHFCFEE